MVNWQNSILLSINLPSAVSNGNNKLLKKKKQIAGATQIIGLGNYNEIT